jgi:predicted transposase/invertase (TIGR01784 family)
MKEEKYINPFTDFGFKKLFGEEANKDLLIDFLNSLLYQEHKIVDLTFKKNEQLGNTEPDRKAIFDLYCIDEKGQRFIVELQKAEQKFFKDRTVYYSTFPIQEQAEKGEWNYKLEPVYCIGILDFKFEDDKDYPDKYFYRVGLADTETNKLFYDKLFYIYLEIPKFNKLETDLNTNAEKWMYFLKNLSKLNEIPNSLKTEMFIKAFQIAEIANFTQEQKKAYENSMKYYRDLKNVIDKSYDDGELSGIQKVAKNMKENNEPIEKIIKYTGLTKEEINKL